MMVWRYALAGACIAVACSFLHPQQPASVIATGLLTTAMFATTWRPRD